LKGLIFLLWGDQMVPTKHISMKEVIDQAVRNNSHSVRCYLCNDSGNKDRFIDRYGDNVIFSAGKWYIWNGKIWQKDENEKSLYELIEETVKDIFNDAQTAQTHTESAQLGKWASSSLNANRLKAMKGLVEKALSLPIAQLDSFVQLIQLQEGKVLDCQTLEVRDTQRDDYLTLSCNVSYDPSARAPRWERFIEEISYDPATKASDPAWMKYVQVVMGTALSGVVDHQMAWFFYGAGANGKSTLLNTIAHLLGDYSRKLPASSLMAKKYSSGGTASNDIAMLRGARLAVTSETSGTSWFDDALIKDLCGGDKISCRFLYQDFFEFVPQFTLIMYGNSRPRLRHVDGGMTRRLKMVPFDFHSDKREDLLSIFLGTEKTGILNWLIEGLRIFNEIGVEGLIQLEPDRVRNETSEYFHDQDKVRLFLDDMCNCDNIRDGESAGVTELYTAFRKWCENVGEQPFSKREFSKQLESKGFKQERTSSRRFWKGISLRKGYGIYDYPEYF